MCRVDVGVGRGALGIQLDPEASVGKRQNQYAIEGDRASWLARLKGPSHWRLEDAERLIAEATERGVDLRVYAREVGVRPSRLVRWSQQFDLGPEAMGRVDADRASPFIELRAASHTGGVASRSPDLLDAHAVVHLGGGVAMEVRGLDAPGAASFVSDVVARVLADRGTGPCF